MDTQNKPEIMIGIDPDIIKSGVAFYIIKDKCFQFLNCLPFFDVIHMLECYKKFKMNYAVRLEAGWLIKKSNWHQEQGNFRREKIAKNVGENHCIGKLFEQFMIKENISYQLVKPLGKLTHKEFCNITGWSGTKTNQEKRDAAMLVWGY